MSKDDYVLRSLSKTRHKRIEHFVVNRIYHLLDDPEIEFICQQLVRRKEGPALTDMFFPQFRLHLEVDEPFHARNVEADQVRAQDIVTITSHEIRRIRAYDGEQNLRPLSEIAQEVDHFVALLRDRKNEAVASQRFEAWNYERQYDPTPHIERGHIDASDNVIVRYQKDALQCFGYTGGHYQRGLWRLDTDLRRIVWFPRLWKHGEWENALSADGNVITEDASGQAVEGYRIPMNDDFVDERIVFAKWHDPLGRNVYRFTGVFRKCKESSTGQITAFRKVSDRFDLRRLTTLSPL